MKTQERLLETAEHVIRQMSATGGRRDVLGIYEDGGLRLETLMLTIPARQSRTPESTKMVFHRIGTDDYFDKIWIPGKNCGYELPMPERLRSRLNEMKQSDVEASHQEVDREGKSQDEAKKPSEFPCFPGHQNRPGRLPLRRR